MKTMTYLKLLPSLVIAAALFAACGKQDEAKPAAPNPSAPGNAASEAQKSVTAVADQAQEAAKKAAAEAQKQAGDAAAAAQAQVQGIVDQAKSLLAEKKYADALNLLQQKLAGLKLTPDQQKLVDGLKEQIQQALASSGLNEAAKSAGDLNKVLGK
jgi:hypothetical protein